MSEIAQLIRAVEESGLCSTSEKVKLECKLGDRYDADIASIMELVAERPDLPNMLTAEWMGMDLDELDLRAQVAERYISDNRGVYRAWAQFGSLPIELHKAWTVENPNDLSYFRPESVHFQIDPWTGPSNEQNADVVLGYLSFAICGDGLFFPRTASHYIDMMASHPALARIADACASIWPANPRPATRELVEIRECMRTNWPHDLEAPTGWHWMGG